MEYNLKNPQQIFIFCMFVHPPLQYHSAEGSAVFCMSLLERTGNGRISWDGSATKHLLGEIDVQRGCLGTMKLWSLQLQSRC